MKTRASLKDCELKAFHKMIKSIRGLSTFWISNEDHKFEFLKIDPKACQQKYIFIFQVTRICWWISYNEEQTFFISAEFPFNDPTTNVGYVVSPMMESSYAENTSLKLIVYYQRLNLEQQGTPSVSFTCDGNNISHFKMLYKRTFFNFWFCWLLTKIKTKFVDDSLKIWILWIDSPAPIE